MLTAIEFIGLLRLVLAASNGELPEDLDRDQMDMIFAKLCPLQFKLDGLCTHVSFMPSTSGKRRVDEFPEWLQFPFEGVEDV